MKRTSLVLLTFLLFSTTAFAQVIEGTFAIKNVETGMLLRIKDANGANGTPLVAYPPVNWKCVTWDFKHLDGQTYQLRNLFTNKTFQSAKGVVAEGVLLTPVDKNGAADTGIMLAAKNGTKLQQWTIYLQKPTM